MGFTLLQNWDQMCGQSLPAALHSSIQRKDFMEVSMFKNDCTQHFYL